jgi:hypothetical protein
MKRQEIENKEMIQFEHLYKNECSKIDFLCREVC